LGQAISVRLDDEATRALRALEAAGISRSAAIRAALIESARRLRRRSELAAEVAALEADESDLDPRVGRARPGTIRDEGLSYQENPGCETTDSS